MPLYNPASAASSLTVEEEDGAPSVAGVTKIQVPNGSLTNDSGTIVSLAYATALVGGEAVDYVEFTSPVSITATTEGTANTIVTGSSVTYDGTTGIMVQFFCPYLTVPGSAVNDTIFVLYDNGSSIGLMGLISTINSASTQRLSNPNLARKLTPSAAAHTYSVRAYVGTGTASVGAGAGGGGGGAHIPGFIRITKV